MQKVLTVLLVSMTLMAWALTQSAPPCPAVLTAAEAAKNNFRRDAVTFAGTAKRLRMTVMELNPGLKDPAEALAALKDCRIRYKKIESFLSWFFPAVATGINGPPVYEGEEPFMEYQEPRGMQVMETLLTDKKRLLATQRLLDQANLLVETAGTLPALMYDFFPARPAFCKACGWGLSVYPRLVLPAMMRRN